MDKLLFGCTTAAISTLSSTQQWWHAAQQFSPPAQPATLSHSFTCGVTVVQQF